MCKELTHFLKYKIKAQKAKEQQTDGEEKSVLANKHRPNEDGTALQKNRIEEEIVKKESKTEEAKEIKQEMIEERRSKQEDKIDEGQLEQKVEPRNDSNRTENEQNKEITRNELSTYEMRFKNLNQSVTLSKPVQNCMPNTLLLIIGINQTLI